jgi:predicted RNA-binding Zn-ribbon protein involved in translation (DUF1610 family)
MSGQLPPLDFDPTKVLVSDDAEAHCPSCGYSLGGQAEDVVRCPECGIRFDATMLMRQGQDTPWYSTIFTWRRTGVVWILVVGAMMAFSMSFGFLFFAGNANASFLPYFLKLMIPFACLWLLLTFAFNRLRLRDVVSSFLAQLVLLLILLSFGGVVMNAARTTTIVQDQGWSHAMPPLLYTVLCAVLFVPARWLGKRVARRCMRLHYEFYAGVQSPEARDA